MPIPFTCPYCGKSTTVDDRFAGQSGPCGACGKTVTVPYAGMSPAAGPARSSGGAGIVIGIVVALVAGGGCVVAILVALLLPAVQAARTAAKRSQSSNNLKQIGLALHNYHDTYGQFPPAYVADASGKPLYSWRVMILPFMEQGPLFNQFDKTKAWDDPANIAISNMAMPVYRSPNDDTAGDNGTNYFVVVGPDTMFPPDRGIKMFDITDGTSNTIAVIETKGISGSWAAPIDPTFDRLNPKIGNQAGQIQSLFPGGTNVLLSDGSVRFMAESTDAETMRRLIQRNDGQVVPLY